MNLNDLNLKGERASSQFQLVRWVFAGALLVAFFIGISMIGSVIENVDAHELMVVQAPKSGQLSWYTTPGIKWQGFGKTTTYPRQFTYNIETKVRFNDGGTGTLFASIQVRMPTNEQQLNYLHQQYGSADAINAQLVAVIANKAVTMTTPMMSSRESYAEKRNYLINWAEDQIANGIYRTIQREVQVTDLGGQRKTAIVVEIVQGQNGQPIRQEQAVLTALGMTPFNFSLTKDIEYDDQVKKQIEDQQRITMAVQTSMAEARQAEQRRITITQQAEANIAEAKGRAEVEKQKAVTEGEQRLAVARLANQEADQYKESKIKRADADATAAKLLMNANGALELKLQTYERVQGVWANAFSNYKGNVVPAIVTGGQGSQQNAAINFMDLLGIKAARDLALDFQPPQRGGGGGGQR